MAGSLPSLRRLTKAQVTMRTKRSGPTKSINSILRTLAEAGADALSRARWTSVCTLPNQPAHRAGGYRLDRARDDQAR